MDDRDGEDGTAGGVTTEGTKDETIAKGKNPPAYGSKKYWDQRYEKLLVDPKAAAAAATTMGKSTINEENDDDPVAFHSWYFSYDDLKPIILPLVLGGKEAAQRLLGPQDEEEEENDADNSLSKLEGESKSSKIFATKPADDDEGDDDEEDLIKTEADDNSNIEETENADEDEDGWEEADGDDHVSGDEEEEEEEISQTETGLIVDKPVSVLEVGCGDVPLVLEFAKDIASLKSEIKIVDRIVCTDYSATLIDTLKRIHQKKRKLIEGDDTKGGDDDGTAKTTTSVTAEKTEFPVEYLVADARDLPFPDQTFHLILEKGTMDAMISDAEVGESNCIGIVSDCARVLAIGGCFFLVSHINAHTSKGEEWLNDVVLTGLRQGGGEASWNIEVHGNNQGDDNGDDDDDASEHPEAAVPAVYLIFKGPPPPKVEDGEGPEGIPLKFFCY